MPSWHPLTQTGPRFGILPSLGRSSRLLGHGQPRPIRWFSRIVWGARIKWAPYQAARRRRNHLRRGGASRAASHDAHEMSGATARSVLNSRSMMNGM